MRELGSAIDRAAILGDSKLLEIAKALGAMDRRPALKPSPLCDKAMERIPCPRSEVLPLDAAMRTHHLAACERQEGSRHEYQLWDGNLYGRLSA